MDQTILDDFEERCKTMLLYHEKVTNRDPEIPEECCMIINMLLEETYFEQVTLQQATNAFNKAYKQQYCCSKRG